MLRFLRDQTRAGVLVVIGTTCHQERQSPGAQHLRGSDKG
jgi:hypothetical protein